MKKFFALPIFIVVLELATAAKKGEENLVATMADLAKERLEMKEMFRRENEKLRAEAENLRNQADQLRGQDDKLREQDDKLRAQNEKLQKEVAKLRREQRKSDLRVKTSLRQKDQNESLEFEKKMRQSIRQKDLSSELKKMMRGEIQEFLKDERICESGRVGPGWSKGNFGQTETVRFAKTFLRPPTVHASLSGYQRNGKLEKNRAAYFYSNEITTSYFTIYIGKGSDVTYFSVSWIACL